MRKIRTLVAHSSEEIRNTIVNSIGNLNYVEIIGTAMDGVETYNKIIELKPEIVFSKFNFENMNGLDLIKKTKETLQKDLPIFNIIEDKIPDNELREALDITNHKIHALVREPYSDRVIEIMEIYKNNS